MFSSALFSNTEIILFPYLTMNREELPAEKDSVPQGPDPYFYWCLNELKC